MLKPSYQLSTYLYRNYHIAEWPEKCCILTEDEQREILSSLEVNIHPYNGWLLVKAYKAKYWRPPFGGFFGLPIAFVSLTYP